MDINFEVFHLKTQPADVTHPFPPPLQLPPQASAPPAVRAAAAQSNTNPPNTPKAALAPPKQLSKTSQQCNNSNNSQNHPKSFAGRTTNRAWKATPGAASKWAACPWGLVKPPRQLLGAARLGEAASGTARQWASLVKACLGVEGVFLGSSSRLVGLVGLAFPVRLR